MDVLSKACVSNPHLWTAENVHVTLSSTACHGSTKPGTFFSSLCQCLASLQPLRSGSISQPTFVPPRSIPSTLFPRSCKGNGGTRRGCYFLVVSSTRSSLLVLRPRTRTKNPQYIERKTMKERNIGDKQSGFVSTLHFDEDERTDVCSTHRWGRGGEPAGRACSATAGGFGWS